MENNYSFWEVFKRQWSWKNDRLCLLFELIFTIILISVWHLTDSIAVEPVDQYWNAVMSLFIVMYVLFVLVYQVLKFIGMLLFFYLVTRQANIGNTKAISIYNESLNWRQ